MIERKTETRIVGPEQRQRHVAERLPVVGAVDQGRLLELLRDALQPGQHEDHVEAEVLPRDDHEHRQHHEGRRRPASPGRGTRGPSPVSAESTKRVGLEQQPEHDAGDGLGQDVRQEEQQPEHRPARNRRLSITASASENGIWIASDRTTTSRLLPMARPEAVARQRDLVVLEADEVGERREPVPLVQAEVGGLDDREHHEQHVERQRGHPSNSSVAASGRPSWNLASARTNSSSPPDTSRKSVRHERSFRSSGEPKMSCADRGPWSTARARRTRAAALRAAGAAGRPGLRRARRCRSDAPSRCVRGRAVAEQNRIQCVRLRPAASSARTWA